jgi:uncharacterized protein YhaN
MIFITKEKNSIWIPRHTNHIGPMKLTLKHNLTGTEYVFDSLTNVGDSTQYWIFYGLDFGGLQSGEYNYNLSDIETGLLQVGYDVTEPISYNTEKTIVQYGS